MSKCGLMVCFIVRKYVIFNSLTPYATELAVIVKFPYTKVPLYLKKDSTAIDCDIDLMDSSS